MGTQIHIQVQDWRAIASRIQRRQRGRRFGAWTTLLSAVCQISMVTSTHVNRGQGKAYNSL